MKIVLSRIRKAITAGIGGGVVAAASTLAEGGLNQTTIKQAIGAFIVGAAVVGYATWQTKPNTPKA